MMGSGACSCDEDRQSTNRYGRGGRAAHRNSKPSNTTRKQDIPLSVLPAPLRSARQGKRLYGLQDRSPSRACVNKRVNVAERELFRTACLTKVPEGYLLFNQDACLTTTGFWGWPQPVSERGMYVSSGRCGRGET